jgi:hypothetical protein
MDNKALKRVSSYVDMYVHCALCPLWLLACMYVCVVVVVGGGGVANATLDYLLRSTSCEPSPNLNVKRWRYRTFCYRYFIFLLR